MTKTGKTLYLSGGGARGAYQVGVLKAVQEITGTKQLPFDSISSVSAGAINASMLAQHASDFPKALERLLSLWSQLSCSKIYLTNNLSLLKSALRNTYSLMFHRALAGGAFLLDTSPLKKLLETELNFDQINSTIDQGVLTSLAITATCYDNAKTISFIKSKQVNPGWIYARHSSQLTELNSTHVLASAAFPLFFPAININGAHYGDGGLRLNSPLRSAIKLGADHIFVIGTRQRPKPDATLPLPNKPGITFAKILGYMLNALFSDNLDRDVEMVEKINRNVILSQTKSTKPSSWRNVNVLYITPSVDLAVVAEVAEQPLPILLRYFLHAFGSKSQSNDIMSFLLFDATYCQKLIDIGYNDALKQREAIESFFIE